MSCMDGYDFAIGLIDDRRAGIPATRWSFCAVHHMNKIGTDAIRTVCGPSAWTTRVGSALTASDGFFGGSLSGTYRLLLYCIVPAGASSRMAVTGTGITCNSTGLVSIRTVTDDLYIENSTEWRGCVLQLKCSALALETGSAV